MQRIYRLKGRDNFRLLLRRGRKIESPLFKIIFRKNQLPHGRFAFVAPLSVSKKATVRNRLKRRAREWIRKNPSLLKCQSDTVIFLKNKAALVGRKQFYEELDKLFKELPVA